jgi:hypothetical protein
VECENSGKVGDFVGAVMRLVLLMAVALMVREAVMLRVLSAVLSFDAKLVAVRAFSTKSAISAVGLLIVTSSTTLSVSRRKRAELAVISI